jgi:hypothetical protein
MTTPNPSAMDQLSQTLKDGAYAAVGLGVLGFQRAQVRRHELTEQLKAQRGPLEQQMKALETQIWQLVALIEERLNPARPAIEVQLAGVRQQLVVLLKVLDEQLQPAREELERRVSEFEERLPEQARAALDSMRTAFVTNETALPNTERLD